MPSIIAVKNSKKSISERIQGIIKCFYGIGYIFSKFVLSPASIKFKTTRDRAIVVHSNVLSLK
ncbi:hypothetical protein CMO89_03915 [Candidatus Woesearchaeota archaeon]|nr:hypothetical protein [Candidatus Woesearchaeota archaeon]